MLDIADFNRDAWNSQVEKGNIWTRPVDSAMIKEAKEGRWQVLLTPTKPVPAPWFPPMKRTKVLCLACGGGQQGPLLAAAGGTVTVFDNSPRQLEQDRIVAEREMLHLSLEMGDMRDLSRFPDACFDLVFNPVSVIFVDDALRVWREAHRVLKPGGTLLVGHANPIQFVFDMKAWEAGQLVARHKIPYSDLKDLSAEEFAELVTARTEPLCFGHSMEALIQGQIDAGFAITGFYEDTSGDNEALDRFIDTFFATRAEKR